jgi:thioredoxin 1
MDHLQSIDEHDFDRDVLLSASPVLVDFTAPWCAPCRALSPILARLASEARGRLKVVAVDGDAFPAVAARFGVRAFPTVILFAGGKEIGRRVGLGRKEDYARMLEREVTA